MLDAFLETVAAHSKVADARASLDHTLARLPDELLHKIASGSVMPKEAFGGEDGICWLDKFKGTPLFDEAIAIEKEDLAIQMDETNRRRQETELRQTLPTWDETDLKRQELSIKRKLLELELAGAGAGPVEAGGQEGEDIAAETPPALPEAAAAEAAPPPPPKPSTEKVTKETTEKPPAEKVDIKTAGLAMRFSLAAARVKEAQPATRASAFRR